MSATLSAPLTLTQRRLLNIGMAVAAVALRRAAAEVVGEMGKFGVGSGVRRAGGGRGSVSAGPRRPSTS